ncbi:MAG: hypothetical protein AB7O56_15250 [Bauldia sp.]
MIIRKLAALAALSIAAAAALPASAQTPFDGGWAVQVFTEDADCQVTDAVPIRIADGNVRYGGWFGPSTTGEVNTAGALQIRISYFGDVVNVAGQLAGETGTGYWISPTLECNGTWTAVRT